MPYQGGFYRYDAAQPTSGLAIGAMICGIAEIFTLGFAAIPAVILGHLARAQIKRRASAATAWPSPASSSATWESRAGAHHLGHLVAFPRLLAA